MMLTESRRSKAHFDFWLTVFVYILSAFGILCVAVATFSTSSDTEDTLLNYIVASHYGLRQAIFFLISPVVVGVITFSRTSSSAGAPSCSTTSPARCCWSRWAARRRA